MLTLIPLLFLITLSSSSKSFIANLDFMSTPNFLFGALTHEGWHRAMEEEMLALEHNGT